MRGGAPSWRGSGHAALLACVLFAALIFLPMRLAHAIEAISVEPNQEKIEITAQGEAYEGRGDPLQIETAPGADGVGRMSVPASTPGTNPGWFVFALTNRPRTHRALARRTATRWLGQRVWPDLDARRIDAVTPSVGFRPEPLKNDRADVFRLTLEPGQTVTFVAELARTLVPPLSLWNPNAYRAKQQDRQLFNGIMLGITGLLAIFLTAMFAANHKAIFPATALFTWCVLAYLCVDFGFWHKLFTVRPEENALYRAATEAGMAASLLIFLYTFLRIGLWHGWIRMLFWAWMAAQFALVFLAIVDPPSPPAFARLSARRRRRRRGVDRFPRFARPGSRALAGADLDAADGVAVRRRHDRHSAGCRATSSSRA